MVSEESVKPPGGCPWSGSEILSFLQCCDMVGWVTGKGNGQ